MARDDVERYGGISLIWTFSFSVPFLLREIDFQKLSAIKEREKYEIVNVYKFRLNEHIFSFSWWLVSHSPISYFDIWNMKREFYVYV